MKFLRFRSGEKIALFALENNRWALVGSGDRSCGDEDCEEVERVDRKAP
jgi:hypothetical protein